MEQYAIPVEISTEHNAFKEVVNLLNSTNIPTVYELKTGTKTISGMQKENLEAIRAQLDIFRSSILIQ